MYRIAVALLFFSVVLARPLNGLYQSNGLSCSPFPVDKCVACGSAFYKCSFYDDDDGGSYNCFSSTMSDCSGTTTNQNPEPFCPGLACRFATISNYQLEASAPSGGIGFAKGEMVGEVTINSTSITSTALAHLVIATSSSRGLLWIEDGVFDDDTYLTNQGKCAVGDWCTATPDLSYRLTAMPSNDTIPVYDIDSAAVKLYIDGGVPIIAASDVVSMLWFDRRLYASADQLGSISAHFWPSSVVWSNFEMEEMNNAGEDPKIIWEMSAGKDFSLYQDEECTEEEDDGIVSCHLDFSLSFSDWIDNPFLPPFFSFSFEADAQVNDEEWVFSLFE